MPKLNFTLAAWSEAAARPTNEDSFLIGKDLSAEQWSFETNETLTLGRRGALIVVCDGMGGAKAGMGSTVVLAWLLDGEVHIGWCGDSRAYRFNPATGLERLSRDHSYVQELVDAGLLAPELAHQHPNSNIITRSLVDSGREAQPEVRTFTLYRDALLAASQAAGWTDNVTLALCRILSGAEKTVRRPLMSETVKQGDRRFVGKLRKKTGKSKRRLIVGVIIICIAILFAIFSVRKNLNVVFDCFQHIIPL